MAKAKMYGQKTSYIPNNKADMRFIKKMSRNREREAVCQPWEWAAKVKAQKKGDVVEYADGAIL